MASQITSLTIVYTTVYSGADQRKHLRSASLAFVRGIHRCPVNSPHKWPLTRKMVPFDDIIMIRHVWWNNIHVSLPRGGSQQWCLFYKQILANIRAWSYQFTGVRAWMNNYIHIKQQDVITRECHNFSDGLTQTLTVDTYLSQSRISVCPCHVIGRPCRQPSFPRWRRVPGVIFLTFLWPQSGRVTPSWAVINTISPFF